MLGYGEFIWVKVGECVLFYVFNGSVIEICSLVLLGYMFKVIVLDGNFVLYFVEVFFLWIGIVECISVFVEMMYLGIWVLGDLVDDDCMCGMGIVVEYVGYCGKFFWMKFKLFVWDY